MYLPPDLHMVLTVLFQHMLDKSGGNAKLMFLVHRNPERLLHFSCPKWTIFDGCATFGYMINIRKKVIPKCQLSNRRIIMKTFSRFAFWVLALVVAAALQSDSSTQRLGV